MLSMHSTLVMAILIILCVLHRHQFILVLDVYNHLLLIVGILCNKWWAIVQRNTRFIATLYMYIHINKNSQFQLVANWHDFKRYAHNSLSIFNMSVWKKRSRWLFSPSLHFPLYQHKLNNSHRKWFSAMHQQTFDQLYLASLNWAV